ncbi:hypothetical protein AN478_05945 [Thiohalorhabdus denitrificans]|uniref:Cu(I)/Ag(I) efflux system membrane protein CusA/SilA n=1 Tax=Thiohalorhabdus denitrificans TaxID=381306 RepID=A0A0P9C745_9GAMM|nr:CusA/CzcA family heavy metal efflux RND transporter [Thiohalorhabdus denitrificans]KPV40696.1 hypothetical protein AN478_05945 [Thiohalorhabdus denitrificans]SCY46699.1 Cu(I)/Ag(I) efflux system membrane protein CusA/SilA [Thiohalorhabdus denitrificans]
MINRILEFATYRRTAVYLLVLAAIGIGILSLRQVSFDAIPDVSDTQVIIYAKWPGQSPGVIEDQVTYPLSSTMLHVPQAKDVRGYSAFGYSLVYVLFDGDTDLYWARSRVLEYLDQVKDDLPERAEVSLGPDATGVGWIYQYALKSDRHDLSELRTLQDWYLRYALEGVQGVSEVASVGGYVRQYQVELDPNRLRAFDIGLDQVVQAVKGSNSDEGGRLIERGGHENLIRGLGYVQGTEDLAKVPVRRTDRGVPVTLGQLGTIQVGADQRRGITDLNGQGQVAGGIVVMQHQGDAWSILQRVQDKIAEVRDQLPDGVTIEPVYDREPLIERSVATLGEVLWHEALVVAAVILLFLWHARSTLVVLLTLPAALLISFAFIRWMDLTLNIMSLGGIALAIGAMVDAAIVMVENAHKHLERLDRPEDREVRLQAVLAGMKEVAAPIFVSLLVLTVSFLPLLLLPGEAGRLFSPLVWTKTLAMAIAAVLSITLIVALTADLVRGRIRPEGSNPISAALIRAYTPVLRGCLNRRWGVILAVVVLGVATAFPATRLGKEFMPPLFEGSLMYMPTTNPGVSITEIGRVMQNQDRALMEIPEVEKVFGKAGRADTATDPAPLSMIETIITLKPRDQWRDGMTPEKLQAEMEDKVSVPGLVDSWTMPIRGRIDMLSTGVRTPLGIKLHGDDLRQLDRVGAQIEEALQGIEGADNVYADRTTFGYFTDVDINRRQAGRYGLNVDDVQETLRTAVGGANLTWTVEGRERYPVMVRYRPGVRDGVQRLQESTLVPFGEGGYIPLDSVADVEVTRDPNVIKSEDGFKANYVYIDLGDRDRDPVAFVEEAKQVLAEEVDLPDNVYMEWTGSYQYFQQSLQSFYYIIPVTLLIVLLLYQLVFRDLRKSLLILGAIPFSLIGAVWLLYLLDYRLSVAVGVGLIALAGVAAETAMVMMFYIDHAIRRRREEGRLRDGSDLYAAIREGAVMRLRPVMMTVLTVVLALMPLMYVSGTGSEVMHRIAAPMIGGALSALLLVLLVVPVAYTWLESRGLPGEPPSRDDPESGSTA